MSTAHTDWLTYQCYEERGHRRMCRCEIDTGVPYTSHERLGTWNLNRYTVWNRCLEKYLYPSVSELYVYTPSGTGEHKDNNGTLLVRGPSGKKVPPTLWSPHLDPGRIKPRFGVYCTSEYFYLCNDNNLFIIMFNNNFKIPSNNISNNTVIDCLCYPLRHSGPDSG